MRPPETSSSRLVTSLAVLLIAVACGGTSDVDRPTLTFALTADQQDRWSDLERRFVAGSAEERAAMAGELDRFSKTPWIGRAAEALFAWALLEKGETRRALAIASRIEKGPAGTVRDIATVVRGASLRRTGAAVESLRVLRPMVGKVIDAHARDLLNEELALAALDAKRYTEAIAYLIAWLRDVDDAQRPAATSRIGEGIERIPTGPLLAFLREARTETDPKSSTSVVATMAAKRLAKLAGDRGDVELARTLLDESRDLLGDEGDTVAELAVGQHSASVDPSVMGLLLPLGNTVLTRRGIEVTAGLSSALRGEGTRLRVLSRDDGGEVAKTAEALDALSALGASVVVAGFDEAASTAVNEYARERGLVVVLLRPPRGPLPDRAFVLGPDPRAVLSALRASLAERGDAPTAAVADEAALLEATLAGEPPEPACTEWSMAGARQRGARSAAIIGDVACGLRAAREGAGAPLAFGLEAAEVAPPGALIATAGGVAISANDAAPSYWGALGRDAGALVRAALEPMAGLPPAAESDVEARRAAIADALGSVEIDLWTADAKGFGADRRVHRDVRVRAR